jgi:hypothetical protein
MRKAELKDISRLIFKNNIYNPISSVLNDEGNIKIPKTTAIFNMSSATNCPSLKLGLCKAVKQGANCYALKPEIMYPAVLPYRNKQEKYWKDVTAEKFAYEFLLFNSSKRVPFNALRFNEAGDFHTQDCLDKAEKIARYLKKHGIKSYCYTSRSDLNFSNVRDLVVHGSGFTKKGIKGIFKIIQNKKEKIKGFSLCSMSCKSCTLCLKSSNVCIVKH